MKSITRLLFPVLGILLLVTSCLPKDDSSDKIAEEQRLLKQYLENNNITVDPTDDGLYFISQSDSVADTVQPVMGDFVLINYTTRLIDGQVVGTSEIETAKAKNVYNPSVLYGPFKFKLGTEITGVNEGISMMHEGEKARLIIPSDLAYGSFSVGKIPSYSTLIFDVDLLKVIKDPVAYENEQLKKYVADNNLQPDTTASGLLFVRTKDGEGSYPANGDYVKIKYVGKLLDGRVFDSTSTTTFNFTVGFNQVIKGMDEAVKLLKPGGKATFIMPWDIAYGTSGQGQIPPYTTLVFDLELYSVGSK
ncbi:MAG TPA: FKBP-type peptidyl-prolyl cis-trans isomerase [Bacteroidales bacterium]|nr:FKBP-type peptidyl-prolyl cis-trans isomerase [Bacteroidales bacterium]